MQLNVGCGLDVREGWVNVDRDLRFADEPGLLWADALDLGDFHGQCELVLCSHVLHLFDLEQADRVLGELVACLAPGGELVIVEADVIRATVEWLDGTAHWLDELVSVDLEPTPEGRLLRWVTWHGTRRSLWSEQSLAERLARFGLWCEEPDDAEEWAGERAAESFVVKAHPE